MSTKIRFVQKLSEDEKYRMQMLEESCKKTKDIHFKLDPQSLVADNDCVSHVLYEVNGMLEGYMEINCFDGEVMECTAVVNGNKLIFMEMYEAVIERARERRIGKVLFIIDRNDDLSSGWIKDLGLSVSHMEYRMVFDESSFRPSQGRNIVIQNAVAEDSEAISHLEDCDEIESRSGAEEKEPKLCDINNVKIARLNNEIVGKIRVDDIDGTVGLYGFIVSPSRRGEGLGREILNCVIKSITERDYRKIYLEVDSTNQIALNLYKSIGFNIQAAFDYYVYTA